MVVRLTQLGRLRQRSADDDDDDESSSSDEDEEEDGAERGAAAPSPGRPVLQLHSIAHHGRALARAWRNRG